jgi:NADH:ubiquinone oxidoreductase subunit 5 (subunit L)/multisubunit Na+/H+ antiporter MnhA subunit
LAPSPSPAQFPFHFWLPNAMAAPTPVSAYLHSATMVKAGIFLLLRLSPVLSGTELWFLLVSLTGAVTLAYGAYIALLKHDLKGLLAYSTVSHLGLITFLIGMESSSAPSPRCSTSSTTPPSRRRSSWRRASSTTNAARATCGASTACSA